MDGEAPRPTDDKTSQAKPSLNKPSLNKPSLAKPGLFVVDRHEDR